MNSILSLWDALTISIVLIILVSTAMGIMIGFIEPAQAARRVATTLACMVLLVVLPPTLFGIWRSLGVGQRLGIVTLFGVIAYLALRGKPSGRSSRSRDH